MSLAFQVVDGPVCRLGESPLYDEREDALLFCDSLEGAVHQVDLATSALSTWRFPPPVGSLGLARSGRLVIALRDVVGLFDRGSESFAPLAEIEANRPETRLNDGKVGPDGAFWVGTMDTRAAKEPIGSLYRVVPDGMVECKAGGYFVSNGLAFAPDGRTLYHADSRGPFIDRWDLDPTSGAISGRRRLAVLDEATGRPDGGATDADGHYWSAGVSAARLNRFSPAGQLVEIHPLPVAAPTMPCFGGAEWRTLFVTSLREGRPSELLERYPATGRLIAARSPIAGSPVARFADR